MVTSVDNDQRSTAPEVAAAPVPEQPDAPVVEAVDDPVVQAVPVPVPVPVAVAVPAADAAVPADEPAAPEAALEARLAARLESAEERAAAAEATIAALTQRLAELESRAGQAEGVTVSLERGVAAADEQLEILTARVAEVVDAADRDRVGVAAIGADVAELQATVRRLDQDTSIAVAREVEKHTTTELIDGQQRLHQASTALAALAQALADAARQVPSELTADAARSLLDSFAVDVDLLLQQLGHQALGVTTGDVFDPKRHRALRRVPTTDTAADRTVARVIRDGYRTRATDRILLFADVEVYRAADPTPAAADGSSSEKGN